ncbi:MAG: tetratricopeptide repeat protein, partial [Deltaproteobacteria bacterium]
MGMEKGKLRKLKDEAARYLSKGKYEKALKNLQRVKQADPEDLSVYNNIGYLLRRIGKPREAARVFGELGQRLYDKGFLLKAAAAYKIALEIEPGNVRIQQKLAEICSCREKGVPLRLQQPCRGVGGESPEEDEKLQDLAVEQA